MAASLAAARAAQRRVLELVGEHPAVNGVGVARVEEGYGVKVNLVAPPGPPVPDELDGVPVLVEVIGPVRAR